MQISGLYFPGEIKKDGNGVVHKWCAGSKLFDEKRAGKAGLKNTKSWVFFLGGSR